jgi:PAS domain-containing protein
MSAFEPPSIRVEEGPLMAEEKHSPGSVASSPRRLRWQPTPVHLAVLISVVVFVVEMSEVLVYRIFPPVPQWAEPFLDALYMTVLLAPLLYLLIVRRMNNEIARRARLERELRVFNQRLENTVTERTDQLLSSSRQLSQLLDEQRSTTESLQRANQFVGNVFERAPCLILAFDASNHRCMYANARIEDILRHEQDQIVTRAEDVVARLVAHADRDRFLAVLGAVVSGAADSVGRGVCSFLDADGKRVKLAFGVTVLERTPTSEAKELLLTALPLTG